MLPGVVEASRDRGAWVLHAPPGAGKTTRVPPALLHALDPDGLIVLLEPRRVAVRAAARRMAQEAGEAVGQTFGFQVRFEAQRSEATRVLVVTEGLLLRMLASDPLLEDVSVVLFDEFHERSLHADTALALAKAARDVREDLVLGVMSATLAAEPVARFLGDHAGPAPVLASQGRSFPVRVQHVLRPSSASLADQVAAAVEQTLQEEADGDVLVFLPGVREIRDTASAVQATCVAAGVDVLPLHGRLSPAEQDLALAAPTPKPGGQLSRKVVLATNVAETSVTLPAVTTVIDSGLVRALRHDSRRALPRLETVPISQASADQRAGRAGRVRAGRALRLWTERSHSTRPAYDVPEIGRADLAAPILQLLASGEPSATAFDWFEAPPPHAIAAAHHLLQQLDALDADHAITDRGAAMARIPAHPRLAAVLLTAHALGEVPDAALAVALLEDRAPLRATPAKHVGTNDVWDQLEALRGRASRWTLTHPGAARRVRQVAKQLVAATRRATRHLHSPRPAYTPHSASEALAIALAAGFPDRLARRRQADRLQLATGRGARLHPNSAVRDASLLVALDIQDTEGAEAVVHLAAAVPEDALPKHTGVEARYDADNDKLIGVRVTRLGGPDGLVLSRHDGVPLPPPVAAAALAEVATRRIERALPSPRAVLDRWCERLAALHRHHPLDGVPDGSLDSLRALVPRLCHGRRSLADLRKADWVSVLLADVPWKARQALDTHCPDAVKLANGRSVHVSYPTEGPPVLAARMQQFFGCKQTPLVHGAPVMLHLLAPNGRPAQITQDLAGFWKRTWHEVRKELRARYPKHDWPDDPSNAVPPERRRRRHR